LSPLISISSGPLDCAPFKYV